MSLQTTTEPHTKGSVWVAGPVVTLNTCPLERSFALSLPLSIQTM